MVVNGNGATFQLGKVYCATFFFNSSDPLEPTKHQRIPMFENFAESAMMNDVDLGVYPAGQPPYSSKYNQKPSIGKHSKLWTHVPPTVNPYQQQYQNYTHVVAYDADQMNMDQSYQQGPPADMMDPAMYASFLQFQAYQQAMGQYQQQPFHNSPRYEKTKYRGPYHDNRDQQTGRYNNNSPRKPRRQQEFRSQIEPGAQWNYQQGFMPAQSSPVSSSPSEQLSTLSNNTGQSSNMNIDTSFDNHEFYYSNYSAEELPIPKLTAQLTMSPVGSKCRDWKVVPRPENNTWKTGTRKANFNM